MLETTPEFNQALRDLRLRIKNENADQQELKKILVEILGYPNLELAHIHHRAKNMGTCDLLSNQSEMQRLIREKKVQNFEVCNCCGLMKNNDPLPYCTNFNQMNVGKGVHLFFRNYLVNAFVFLLMFLIFSIYALASNLQSFYQASDQKKNILCLIDDEEDGGCGFSALGAGSKVISQNKQKNKMSQIQSWLAVAFTVLWGLIYIIKTHMEQKFIVQMETKRISASDFTLMITHFPRVYLDDSYDENLKSVQKIFKDYGKKINSDYSYEVVKINIGRPLYPDKKAKSQQKQKAKEDLHQKQEVFRRWIRHRKNYVDFPLPFADREKEYDKYYQYYSSHYELSLNYEVPLAEKNILFVTMRSSKAREEVQKRNQPPSWKNFWNLCHENDFPIKDVTITRAPQPEQIRWMNIGFPVKTQYLRKAGLWLLTVVLIGISLGISIGISYINKDRISRYVSVGISLVVTAVNVGIQLIIMFMHAFENQYISSKEQSNIAFKIGIGQLINSIGVPIVVTLIANSDPNVEDKTWMKAGGLVDDVFYIAVFSLFVPIGRLIDPFQIFLKLRRWWFEDPDRRLNMYGQVQLNQYYGNYQFDIGYEYAYLIKTSIFTAFFVSMQPIIAIFAPIGLLLYYFIDKRNLLRHFQRPSYHSASINRTVDFLLLFSPIAFGFGALLVNNFIDDEIEGQKNGTLLSNWIIVIIGVAFLIIVPMRIFYRCVTRPAFPLWDYYDKKAILNSDYDRLNPATKSQAIAEFEKYLQELQKKQELPDHSQLIKLTMSNVKKREKPRMISMAGSNNELPKYNYDLDNYRNIVKRMDSRPNDSSRNQRSSDGFL